jgi:hypothetical protein
VLTCDEILVMNDSELHKNNNVIFLLNARDKIIIALHNVHEYWSVSVHNIYACG